MTALRDPIPLGNHRASVAGYLRGIVFPAGSVAARIIEERLPADDAADPLRPSLVLWACAAGKGNLVDALPVAAAFDLFDRFLLLHDELASESPAATVARWGLGQSLNAGDALYAMAFRCLASDVLEPNRRLATASLVGQAVLEAIAHSADDARRSGVLTSAALEAGAVIAGSPEPVVRRFVEAGQLLTTAATAGDRDLAQRAARQAVTVLWPYTPREDLAAFEEVARYVAQRAA